MKFTGKRKENEITAENMEQTKESIANSGMELTEDELDQVSGGVAARGDGAYFWYDNKNDLRR